MNDKIGKEFAASIREATAKKDFKQINYEIKRLTSLMKRTVDGMSPPVQEELRDALKDVRTLAENEDQWSWWEIVLAVLTLGIPAWVDDWVDSAHEEAGRNAAAPIDTIEARPMTAELAAAPNSPLREAFRHLPATGTGNGKVRILSENRDFWARHWEMVGSATKSIDIDYFSLERDVFGMATLGQVLSRMKNHGVKDVRIMTDDIAGVGGPGGFTISGYGADYLDEMAEAGAKVAIYNPVWQRPRQAVQRFAEGGHLAALASNHDKITAVDGKRAITGGRNIGREYLVQGEDLEGAWRDMSVEIEGERAVGALRESVRRELDRETMVDYVGKEWLGNWSSKETELLGAYLLMDNWMKAAPFSAQSSERVKTDPQLRDAMIADMVQQAIKRLPSEGVTAAPSASDIEKMRELAAELVQYHQVRGSINAGKDLPMEESTISILDKTASGATSVEDDIAPSLIELSRHATKTIVIENPYVVLTEGMMQALEEASRNGVEITIITNSPMSTDSDITQAFFLQDWPYVLARLPNARIFVATEPRKFHTKSATIDDEVAWVSTYNLDFLSGRVNSEEGAAIWSKAATQSLRDKLLSDTRDRKHGFMEYTIARDEKTGQALLGKDGKPVVTFGPHNHLSRKMLDEYAKKKKTWDSRRNDWNTLRPLRHRPLGTPPVHQKPNSSVWNGDAPRNPQPAATKLAS